MLIKLIQVLDKKFVPFISEAAIQDKVKSLAAEMDKDYVGKQPLFIAILNGSFMFAADLFKELTIGIVVLSNEFKSS